MKSKFTVKDLVDFGNQLLSEDRVSMNVGNETEVTDADLDRFLNKEK